MQAFNHTQVIDLLARLSADIRIYICSDSYTKPKPTLCLSATQDKYVRNSAVQTVVWQRNFFAETLTLTKYPNTIRFPVLSSPAYYCPALDFLKMITICVFIFSLLFNKIFFAVN